MSRFFRGNNTPTVAPDRTPAAVLLDDLVGTRRESLQAVVDQVEATIKSVAELVAADSDLSRQYRGEIVQPWRAEIMAAHQTFSDAVKLHWPSLVEAVRLIRGGEGRLAVVKYGDLLADLRALEAELGALKRAKPDGVPRVNINQTLGLARRPSQTAEQILSILLDGQTERAALGAVEVEDTTSRLVIEGVEAADITLHLGTSVVYVWAHPAVLEQAVPA